MKNNFFHNQEKNNDNRLFNNCLFHCCLISMFANYVTNIYKSKLNFGQTIYHASFPLHVIFDKN